MLVRPGFELTTSRSADRRSTNWAKRAAVIWFICKVLIVRINSCNTWGCSGIHLHPMTDWRIFKKHFSLNVLNCTGVVRIIFLWACFERVLFMSFFAGLAPFLHIAANSSVVTDLAWCPQYPEYLVTGKPRTLCRHDGRRVVRDLDVWHLGHKPVEIFYFNTRVLQKTISIWPPRCRVNRVFSFKKVTSKLFW